jgi:lysophospholipase
MGGLLACHWLLHQPAHPLTGLVLSSPFLGVAMKVNPVKLMLGYALSRLIPGVSLPFEMRIDDVRRDSDIRIATGRDPFNHRVVNVRWFTEALTAMALVQERASEFTLPTLLLYAQNDCIVDAVETRCLLGKAPASSWRALS